MHHLKPNRVQFFINCCNRKNIFLTREEIMKSEVLQNYLKDFYDCYFSYEKNNNFEDKQHSIIESIQKEYTLVS